MSLRDINTFIQYTVFVDPEGAECSNEDSDDCDSFFEKSNSKSEVRKVENAVLSRNTKKTSRRPKHDLKCQFCEKYFSTKYVLKLHLKTHGIIEKNYSCDECGKKIYTSVQLRGKYTQAFPSKASLNSHNLTHTGEKKCICSICGKGTRNTSDLRSHLRMHTGERPYECKFPDCGKKYKRHGQLTRHHRGHTGEKNHHCTVCSKSFLDSTMLKTHMRTHTGAKPYPCYVCGIKFSYTSSLHNHLKIHRKNNGLDP
ncbi:hypothetical protein NQ317_010148 [Molorchus minor]|uniref:C2H2-type domain-containing protein n=1 Tax=Molorchus minor TaxID=1323400 RepID=A0ABQ9JFF6_9CUCU|nr:hypothetical protein NQ317_010148 [Molorchus minor]